MLAFLNHGTSPDILNALTHPNLKLKILALVASAFAFLLADIVMVRSFDGSSSRAEYVLDLEMLDCLSSVVGHGDCPNFGRSRWNRFLVQPIMLFLLTQDSQIQFVPVSDLLDKLLLRLFKTPLRRSVLHLWFDSARHSCPYPLL